MTMLSHGKVRVCMLWLELGVRPISLGVVLGVEKKNPDSLM